MADDLTRTHEIIIFRYVYTLLEQHGVAENIYSVGGEYFHFGLRKETINLRKSRGRKIYDVIRKVAVDWLRDSGHVCRGSSGSSIEELESGAVVGVLGSEGVLEDSRYGGKISEVLGSDICRNMGSNIWGCENKDI